MTTTPHHRRTTKMMILGTYDPRHAGLFATVREIWQVTDVTEEDFETTEGEVVDVYRTSEIT
jgi:hypothetical protein